MELGHVHNLCILVLTAPTPYHALGCQSDAEYTELLDNYRKLRQLLMQHVDKDQVYKDALMRVMHG